MNTPTRPPRLADYDRAHELKLAEKVATTIAEASTVDGVLVLRIPEITVALIAVLAHMLAREPASVRPPALIRTLNAVHLLLTKHIASALRVAGRNYHSDHGGRT